MSSTPHDAIFRGVLGQPEHARGTLRSAMPAAVAEALDWPTLAQCPGSFVDPALNERHTDLLFSVAWRDGGQALAYMLFEHQSTPDRLMGFRLLRYLVRIWERWLADHPRAKALPVIIPVVLYHGDERWSAPVAFDAMFDVPDAVRPALAPHLVQFTYLLDDLSAIPDDQLRARAMTALARLVEACLKHARTRPDLIEILSSWADVVRDVVAAPDGLEALALVMRYILVVNDHVEVEALQAFLERVAGPEAKDTIMTAGQRLIEQGEQLGLKKGEELGLKKGEELGLKKGEELGLKKGERAVLLRLLRQRFGSQVSSDIEQRLAAASAEQISTWIERILQVATLAELLAD